MLRSLLGVVGVSRDQRAILLNAKYHRWTRGTGKLQLEQRAVQRQPWLKYLEVHRC